VTRTAAKDSVLEQAARSLSVANDTRLPRAVRDEAEEIAAELVTVANATL
jgi:uncharacterized protein (UPF0147 family)